IHAMIVLERGYIFTCMILAAIAAFLIDRRFKAGAGWAAAAAVLTAVGLMHAYQLSGNSVDYLPILTNPHEGALLFRATWIAAVYGLLAVLFAIAATRQKKAFPTANTVEDARVPEPVASVPDEGPIPLE